MNDNVKKRLSTINREIDNIVTVVSNTASTALLNKLTELELEKENLLHSMMEIENELNSNNFSVSEIKNMFVRAKKLFAEGTLATNKKLIDRYVEKILIYKENIDISFNIGFHPKNSSIVGFDQNTTIAREKNPQSSNNGSGDFSIQESITMFDNLLTITEQRNRMKEVK